MRALLYTMFLDVCPAITSFLTAPVFLAVVDAEGQHVPFGTGIFIKEA